MTDWYQQVLTTPEIVEVRIRLGIVMEADHVQVMVEMFDPVTKVQQAIASIPHDRIANWDKLLDWARSKADDWIAHTIEPF